MRLRARPSEDWAGRTRVAGGGGADGAVGEVRVQLDLVDGRGDAGLGDDAVQVGGLEVGDPGGAQPSLGHQVGGGLPGRDVVAVVQGGQRPVNQEQVELVQAEAGHGLVERAADVVRRMVAVGELAGDVHLVAGDAGGRDRPAHAALGAVGLDGVDVPVPGLQGQPDDLGGHVDVGLRGIAARLHAQRPEADLRDAGPVPQRDHRDRGVDCRHR
jgi:hypothetical protein